MTEMTIADICANVFDRDENEPDYAAFVEKCHEAERRIIEYLTNRTPDAWRWRLSQDKDWWVSVRPFLTTERTPGEQQPLYAIQLRVADV